MTKITIPRRKAPRKPPYKSQRSIICVDFDRVIYDTDNAIPGIMPAPLPDTVEAMQQLSRRYDIVIFTLRANTPDISYLVDWLNQYSIPFNEITDTKVVDAVAYIDDKAIRHTSWIDTLAQLGRLGL